MKATCPNDPKHDQFVTVAHVAEDWVVDANGNFIKEAANPERETVHGPTVGNQWTCHICGADAKVTP